MEMMKRDRGMSGLTNAEKYRGSSPQKMNMIVVKLNSGAVLLYNPVKLHKEDAPHLIADWLARLGPVTLLVDPSSAHTLMMGDAIATYPGKFMASISQDDKCQFIVPNNFLP